MAKNENRAFLGLKCTECGEENYISTRNKKKQPEKLEVKKYCSRCKKMTLHKEKK